MVPPASIRIAVCAGTVCETDCLPCHTYGPPSLSKACASGNNGGVEGTARSFSHGSKNRLTGHDAGRFPTDSLFDRIGRTVCEAGCLPRKELYEAWEVARRTRRRFRGGRVVDLAGGHGLLAHIMLLLDDTSPSALVVDQAIPPSAATLGETLRRTWPRLDGRVGFVEQGVGSFQLHEGDVVVSSHACGPLTDVVLDRAVAARVPVAVLPCCHDLSAPAVKRLQRWLDGALAMDVARAERLARAGYCVWTQTIPAEITPKARLLLGAPMLLPG